MDESPAHNFDVGKPIKYEEPSRRVRNLGDEENLCNILVGDD